MRACERIDNVSDTEPVGRRVDEALKSLGKSKQWLESHARPPFSSGYISRIVSGERGRNPSFEVIRRIADALGVNAEWLASGVGPRDATKRSLHAEPYPEREEALAKLRKLVSSEAVEWCRREELAPGTARTCKGWMAAIMAKDAELESASPQMLQRFKRLETKAKAKTASARAQSTFPVPLSGQARPVRK